MEYGLSTAKFCGLTFGGGGGDLLCVLVRTWTENKVRELLAVKVLLTSSLKTAVVAFKVLLLGSEAPMPAPNPPFKTILELVFLEWSSELPCITPDVINVIKMPSFQYFLYLQKKFIGG
jgi:hypothetical protein